MRRATWCGRRNGLGLAAMLTLAALAASCGGGSDGGGDDASRGLGVPGVAVFTVGPDLYIEQDGAVRPLLTVPESSSVAYLSPAIAPDGGEVAYVSFDDSVSGLGSAIRVVDLEGNDRALAAPDEPSEFYWTPRWSADGASVIWTHQVPDESQAFGVRYDVEVFDVESSAVRGVAEGREGDLQANGDLVAYVRDPLGESAVAVVDLDTGGTESIVGVGDGLTSIRLPQFAPDGERIAFLASGDGPAVSARVVAGRNGVQDLWLVRPDGSGLTRLTSVLEDQPDFAWSEDGQHILLRGTFGVYTVDVAARETVTLGPGEFHGSHDWRGNLPEAEGGS
jgi:Tol biopolymer transport system component